MTDSAHAPLQAGRPWPLGADCGAAGVNFAVWAPDATAVELCLFDATGTTEKARLRLPACTDGVWHGLLPGMRREAGASLVYGLRAHGPWAPRQGHRFNPAKLLLDPWAREVVGRYGRQGPGPADDPRLAAELARHQGSSPDAPDWPDSHDNAATALKANGAKKVVAYCTHPVLSGPAVERVNSSDLDALVVTDTIPLRDDAAASPRIRQLSVAEIMAETIRRISNDDSVSSLFID